MPKYYEPKGEAKYGTFYLGEKDYSLFKFEQARVVKENDNTVSVYAIGKAIGLMPSPKPLKITFHKGEYQGWNSQKQVNETKTAYAVEEIIFDQLIDPDFPADGFSGEFEHKTDPSEYSSDYPPFTNVTVLDECKDLPEIPAGKKGGGKGNYDPLQGIKAKEGWYLERFNECLKAAGVEDTAKTLLDVYMLKSKLDAKTAKPVNEYNELLLSFIRS